MSIRFENYYSKQWLSCKRPVKGFCKEVYNREHLKVPECYRLAPKAHQGTRQTETDFGESI